MITLHTNFGDIKIALNYEKAPITAENFEKLLFFLRITARLMAAIPTASTASVKKKTVIFYTGNICFPGATGVP